MVAVEESTRIEPHQILTIESCHSTWLFDEQQRRFRRILKGFSRTPPIATEWRLYARLLVDELSGAFLILLDEAGTRAIRSFRHDADCARCGGSVTTEMSLADLRALIAP